MPGLAWKQLQSFYFLKIEIFLYSVEILVGYWFCFGKTKCRIATICSVASGRRHCNHIIDVHIKPLDRVAVVVANKCGYGFDELVTCRFWARENWKFIINWIQNILRFLACVRIIFIRIHAMIWWILNKERTTYIPH